MLALYILSIQVVRILFIVLFIIALLQFNFNFANAVFVFVIDLRQSVHFPYIFDYVLVIEDVQEESHLD